MAVKGVNPGASRQYQMAKPLRAAKQSRLAGMKGFYSPRVDFDHKPASKKICYDH